MAEANSSSTATEQNLGTVFNRINALLERINEVNTEAYSIAVAGEVYAGTHDDIGASLFSTISNLLRDNASLKDAQDVIADLKRRAAPLLGDEIGGA